MLLLVLISKSLFAAPYPATSSSMVVGENYYFRTKWGFTIQSEKNSWQRLLPHSEDPYHLATYRPLLSAPDSQARLNVRVDPVSKRLGDNASLKSYTSHWLKQYPKSGLDVLKHDFITLSGKDAVRIESYNRNTKIQMRQYVVWEKQNAIIFSCADTKDAFAVSLYACETIVQSLAWHD